MEGAPLFPAQSSAAIFLLRPPLCFLSLSSPGHGCLGHGCLCHLVEIKPSVNFPVHCWQESVCLFVTGLHVAQAILELLQSLALNSFFPSLKEDLIFPVISFISC